MGVFASTQAGRPVASEGVAISTAETVVLPLEGNPPIALMFWTFGHCVLRPEVVHRVVGTDVDGLAVPALVVRGALQRIL